MKSKTILGFILLIAFIAIAYFAYNNLSENYRPDNRILNNTKNPINQQNTITPTDDNLNNDSKKETNPPTEEQNTKIVAPDFTVYDADKNPIKLSDFKGKPVIINFWASWCPPCKSEMPHFDKVYKELGDEVQFLMIDMTDGQRETQQKAEEYISNNEFSFPVFFDTAEDAAYTYGISSIPTTVFIDKDGYAITGVMGAINEETLLEGIDLIK